MILVSAVLKQVRKGFINLNIRKQARENISPGCFNKNNNNVIWFLLLFCKVSRSLMDNKVILVIFTILSFDKIYDFMLYHYPQKNLQEILRLTRMFCYFCNPARCRSLGKPSPWIHKKDNDFNIDQLSN